MQPVSFIFQQPYTLNVRPTCVNWPEHKYNKMGQKATITHTKRYNHSYQIHAKHETTHQLFAWVGCDITQSHKTRQVFYYLTPDKNFSLIHQLYNHITTALQYLLYPISVI